MEETYIVVLHNAYPYEVLGFVMPLILLSMGRASGHKWGATIIAGIYTVFFLGLLWILPLFPAEPKLGPVLNPVTQFIPPGFPLAFLIPAFLMDWISHRFSGSPRWLPYALGVVCFFAFPRRRVAAGAIPAAIAGRSGESGIRFRSIRDYGEGPRSWTALHRFIPKRTVRIVWRTVVDRRSVASMIMARVGFACAEWMKRVRR